MRFESPELLLALLAIPAAVAAYLYLEQRRSQRATAWAPTALLPNMASPAPAWQRHLPVALLLVGAALLLAGFARPVAKRTVTEQQATVVIVLDGSGSMAADDIKPTRLRASVAYAHRLVAKVPKQYRLSVISFTDHAAVIAAPTLDRRVVDTALDSIKSGPQGTAIALAVERAVDVARTVRGTGSVQRPPAVGVLLSDGAQTAGRRTIQQAVAAALAAKMPIYTVAVGTANGVVHQKLAGGYDAQYQVPVDATNLTAIAHGTGAQSFARLRDLPLDVIYAGLGSRVGHRRTTVEVTAVAAGGGLAFMLAGGLLSGLWFRRIP